MPLEESDLKYLWDMLDAGRRGIAFVAGVTQTEFMKDQLRQAAVERVIEVAGEAARRVSESGRRQLPGIAWGAIVATRHIMAHEYGDIDQEQVWRIVSIHIPKLVEQLTPVLEANPPGPGSLRNPGEP